MNVRKGKIMGFRGSWMSGLASLVIVDSDTGVEEGVACENGATVRALEGCFGNVIGLNHCVRSDENAGFYGREVFWTDDAFGLLEAFTPVEDANDLLIAAYEQKHPLSQ